MSANFKNQGKKQLSRRLYSTLMILLLMMPFGWTVLALEARSFSSEQLRHRYHILSNELRCPKCQNQNLADSNNIGGFAPYTYWSSTEDNSENAWMQNFFTGNQQSRAKSSGYWVRAVRAF